jgi:hypothetical protein
VAGVAAAALVVLGLLGNEAYMHRNIALLGQTYGNGPTVSRSEQAAYAWLADHLKPGQQVMNDRFDGSVWMYASAGVQPMEWTFYGAPAGSVVSRLRENLNQLDRSATVRGLVEKADVRYVIVGRGFMRGLPRAHGLTGLARVQGLSQVFHNKDATIYEVRAAAEAGPPQP